MSQIARRPIVGVMGSGSEPHAELAQRLGRWIAERGYHLLTGAGQGVMAAVSEAFCSVEERRGLSIGIVPAGRAAGLYPNRWVELPIVTHLAGEDGPASASSRNPINILSSDVIVLLPGSEGTRAEAHLAVRHGRPAIAWWPDPRTPGIAELPGELPLVERWSAVEEFVLAALAD